MITIFHRLCIIFGTNKLHAELKLPHNFIFSFVFNTVQMLILHEEQS